MSINDETCFTMAENCNNYKPANIDDKGKCFQMMEPPYDCCFVRYRYHAECRLIDTHDKNIYQQTVHQIKAYHGWKDEDDVEIICAGNYITKTFIFLLFIILF